MIGRDDLLTLTRLAHSVGGPLAQAADQLLAELERARIVDAELPADCVRLNDHVCYAPAHGPARDVHLVLPDEADITNGRISVLTPVGAALIGLSAGQSISFTGPRGDSQSLTVISVRRG